MLGQYLRFDNINISLLLSVSLAIYRVCVDLRYHVSKLEVNSPRLTSHHFTCSISTVGSSAVCEELYSQQNGVEKEDQAES